MGGVLRGGSTYLLSPAEYLGGLAWALCLMEHSGQSARGPVLFSLSLSHTHTHTHTHLPHPLPALPLYPHQPPLPSILSHTRIIISPCCSIPQPHTCSTPGG